MKTRSILAVWMFMIAVVACEKLSEPLRNTSQDYPGAPTHLVAQVGDRSVHLSWNAPSGEIKLYYLFRQDSIQTGLRLIDSCTTTFYVEKGLINGQRYIYHVAACNTAGFTGEISDGVSARPGLYSIIINNGALYTNSSTITLRLIAPSGTRYVKIAADSSFTHATWQLYSDTISWSLSPGDGKRSVFAVFLDQEGNQTGSPVVDEIYLDAKAAIYSLVMPNAVAAYRTGDIVSFQMRTDEPYGNAVVAFGSVLGSIRLYDDATHGDKSANDGIYSQDYQIPPCEDVFNISITGSFTDAAGNISDEYISAQTLTIENPPLPVQLFEPERIGGKDKAFHLTWTVNKDADFSLYKLFRSDVEKVDSTSLMVAISSIQTSNYCVDSLLAYNHKYYYRVYVYDQRGLISGSNIVSGQTPADAAPQRAQLQVPLNVTTTSILLSWNQNTESDFAHYRLFRSTQASVSSSDIQVTLISTRATTQFQDSGLLPNTNYWYVLYTTDLAGNMSISNIISATTLPEEKPDAVLLAVPAASALKTLRLSWSVSQSSVFASYRVFRSTNASVDNSATPIVIINNAATTTHDDTGLGSDMTYYYRIYVYDWMGRSTGSNTVYGTTLP